MSACPARALPPPPFLSTVHRHDQSPIAVLMNHSNLLDLKQKQGCYGFMGWSPPPLSGLREVGWGILPVCFIWHWLLCSWHLSPFTVPTGPSSSPCLPPLRHPLPLLHGNCTGLSVCACMCAPVYTCIERYICGGRGEGWSAAQGLQPGHCPLEPTMCPSMLVRSREEGWRVQSGWTAPVLDWFLIAAGRFSWMRGQMIDSPPPSSLNPSLHS